MAGAEQQMSTFQALMPYLMAITAMTMAAMGSAQGQPNRLLRSSPTSTTADR
jgi:hypothetical protein